MKPTHQRRTSPRKGAEDTKGGGALALLALSAIFRGDRRSSGFSICAAIAFTASSGLAGDQATNETVFPIDLPATLRLAHAQNLDIQIARERLNEARAEHQSAVQQFFPWVSPGIGYHRRDGVAQAVPSGIISEAHFQSYSPGAALTAQLALGDAIYNSLAAKQLVKASDEALESQRQDTVVSAAQGYFDLVKARALASVFEEAVRISREYQTELHAAVSAGIAFKGDELRVQTQTDRYQLALRQGREQQRIAAAALAQLLHLDPVVELMPVDGELTPVVLVATNVALHSLVSQALRWRPELRQSQALVAAADEARKGATYGPLVPNVGALVYAGGLGGGPGNDFGSLDAMQDYQVGLSWRIGPGGLFDAGKTRQSRARLQTAVLTGEKLKDEITRQVVEHFTRAQSLADQLTIARTNLATASEVLRLSRERKQFGVGIVLEDIQAQQDLTRARADFVGTVADFNKTQYGLNRAAGGLSSPVEKVGLPGAYGQRSR
jgi:outer membrane protein TolC